MTGGADGRVIVVGAGMGGLAAAIDLAASGVEVLLLERDDRAGGKVRAERVGGVGIDAGPTVFTLRSVFEDLFDSAGDSFSRHVTTRPLPQLARHSWVDGGRLDLFPSKSRSAEAIGDLSGPGDARAYLAFARDSERLFTLLDEAFMRRGKPNLPGLAATLGLRGLTGLLAGNPFRSLWGELSQRFRDPRLRQLFGRYATYCGSSPFEAPATLMLIAHAERAGVWTLEGGMVRLAEAMAGLATKLGASLRFGTEVERIAVGPGGVEGVACRNGAFEPARAVVFNGDCQAMERGLLGSAVQDALPGRGDATRSLSAVTWCLRGRVRGFPLAHHTVFFGDDYRAEFRCLFEEGKIVNHPTAYLCAQDRAGEREPVARDAPERLFALVNAPPGHRSGTGLSGEKLSAVADRTWAWLGRHGLQVDAEAPAIVTSPRDFARRFPGSDGALYGWPTHGWSGSFQRPGAACATPGLFLAGGTVHPGPGVPMAALSGRAAAERVRDYLARGH